MSGTGRTSTGIVLKRDEFIATVTGVCYPDDCWVGNLSFVSNLGTIPVSRSVNPSAHVHYRHEVGAFWIQ